MSRLSYRSILLPSMALMAVGFVGLSQLSSSTTKFEIIMYMIITGLGMGAVYPVVGTAAQSAVDAGNRGVATSVSQFSRSIGGTIGISVFGSLLAQQTSSGVNALPAKLADIPSDQLQRFGHTQALLDPGLRASIPPEILTELRNILGSAISHLFGWALVFVLIGLAVSIFMGKTRLVEAKKQAEPL